MIRVEWRGQRSTFSGGPPEAARDLGAGAASKTLTVTTYPNNKAQTATPNRSIVHRSQPTCRFAEAFSNNRNDEAL
ncbi:hypothetical protein ACC702_28805 [Rhizobium ruizarguesonis]|uniref:hypothetical protein n=1 Tax=Rhizobium ruizarguesonis TaxID=2081791 RepID=UPI0013EEC21B|nr:hypothetical protein [Rhizobium ruizarguesonis]